MEKKNSLFQHEIEVYLRDCFARETSPRVSELARRLGWSRTTFVQRFTVAFGVAPSAFLKARQLEHATGLLRSTRLTSAQIAYRCGFGTRRTMFRTFRRALAVTPQELRGLDEMSLANLVRNGVQPRQRSK